ncbi:uncharacterized protein LOC114789919 [Denticeps clupeoides]|uniref:uncharacterized protein LOC114789919 n=1 Tax=Denticeps clupeoides TaxID=299321 RepID=UPI0010A3BDEF|nr:uncharacterized protein LOC114789919 [Denticeps clupeoides]
MSRTSNRRASRPSQLAWAEQTCCSVGELVADGSAHLYSHRNTAERPDEVADKPSSYETILVRERRLPRVRTIEADRTTNNQAASATVFLHADALRSGAPSSVKKKRGGAGLTSDRNKTTNRAKASAGKVGRTYPEVRACSVSFGRRDASCVGTGVPGLPGLFRWPQALGVSVKPQGDSVGTWSWGQSIRVEEDYCPEVLSQQAEYKDVLAEPYQHGLRPAILYTMANEVKLHPHKRTVQERQQILEQRKCKRRRSD